MSRDISETVLICSEDLYASGMGCEKVHLNSHDFITALEEFDAAAIQGTAVGLSKIQIHTATGSTELLRSMFPRCGEIVIDTGGDKLVGAAIKNGPYWQGEPCLYRTRWWDSEVIIVTSVKLLIARAGGMQDLQMNDDYRMWSPAVIKKLADSAQHVLVLHDTDLRYKVPLNNLDQYVKSLGYDNIEVQEYPGANHVVSLGIWKKRIMRLGGVIYEGSKDFSPIQMLTHSTDASHITFVGEGGSDKYGIFRESRSKFLELVKERERKAIW